MTVLATIEDPTVIERILTHLGLRDVLHAMRRIDWQTGRLLRVFLDRRLYRLMRFPSAGRYLTERLGLSARKAPGTICAAFTPGACARTAPPRARSPGRLACAPGSGRSCG